MLEVVKDKERNFVECSVNNDCRGWYLGRRWERGWERGRRRTFLDFDGPGADGLHFLEVRDLDHLGLMLALAELGVVSILPITLSH